MPGLRCQRIRASAPTIELRLIEQFECLLLDGEAHLVLQIQPIGSLLLHFRREELEIAAAVLLGLIHRGISLAHQHRQITAILRKHARADTGRDVQPVLATDQDGPQRRHDVLEESFRLLVRNVRQQKGELVAAHARHRVRRTQAFRQALAHFLQQLVADMVPQRIVHILEMVEIQQRDDEVLLIVLSILDRDPDAIVEQCTVRQPGQGVMQGDVSDPLLRSLLLGNVIGDAQIAMDLEFAIPQFGQ
jgi:hypothetical protein